MLSFQEPVPVEELVTLVCDVKQQYTQFGGTCNCPFAPTVMCACDFPPLSHFSLRPPSLGLRPFGTSILFMGYDKHYGFQLYQSDPSGNFGGWLATCIGANSQVRCACRSWRGAAVSFPNACAPPPLLCLLQLLFFLSHTTHPTHRVRRAS